MTQWSSIGRSSRVSQPSCFARALLHHVVVCFVRGLGWPNRVFRESCHQDVPWVHASTISSILRMLVCFVTMAIALSSLLRHWGALSLCATISAVAKTGPIWKEDWCWRDLRKIGNHISKKTKPGLVPVVDRVGSPTEVWTTFRGVAARLRLALGSTRFLQADLHDILQADESACAGVLNLLVVTWPQESSTHVEPVCTAERGNIFSCLALVAKALCHHFLTWLRAGKARWVAEQVHTCLQNTRRADPWMDLASLRARVRRLLAIFHCLRGSKRW